MVCCGGVPGRCPTGTAGGLRTGCDSACFAAAISSSGCPKSESRSVAIPRLMLALMGTPENKSKTYKFLEDTTARGRTDPIPGLEAAFKLQPQLLFLLTDGDFPDNEAVKTWIRQQNKDKKIKINTIAFVGTEDKEYQKVLREIAQENGGVFRFVSEQDLGH